MEIFMNYSIISVTHKRVVLYNCDTCKCSRPYNSIGPNVNIYFRTRCADRFGFITIHKDVCAPKYLKIPKISELFFYGFARVQGDEGWGLVDADGYEILETKYRQIYIYNEEIVIFGNSGLYGLFFPATGIKTEAKYTDCELRDTYIITFSNEGKGVLLYNGMEIFEPKYANVALFSKSIFEATKQNGNELLNSTKWERTSTEADDFATPVRGFIKARHGNLYAFIDEKTGKNICQFKYRETSDFNDLGFAYVRNGYSIQMLDKAGKEHSKFKKIF